jgi:tetratricopeptide (TPR) repeat protein
VLPVFSRASVAEDLVQSALERARNQVTQNPRDGRAQYTLALCYLNYGIPDKGLQHLQEAAELMPEKDRISYEVAIIHASRGAYAPANQYILRALQLAPNNSAYRLMHHYVIGREAASKEQWRSALDRWLAAYQQDQDFALAHQALTDFVSQYERELTKPIAHTLPNLTAEEAKAIQLINQDPAAQQPITPVEPIVPSELGSLSMRLLRKVSPARAAAVEKIHEERLRVYKAESEAYSAQNKAVAENHELARRTWRDQVKIIRNNLPLMVKLCLAVVEEKERRHQEDLRRAEEERQRIEQERQRQMQTQLHNQMLQQQQYAQQPPQSFPASAPPPSQPIFAKRYLSTKATYLIGLPKGKTEDEVNLTVTSVQVQIKHGGVVTGWEYSFPIAFLLDVGVERGKRDRSADMQLRISFRDARGGVSTALFGDLRAEYCAKRIRQAMADR